MKVGLDKIAVYKSRSVCVGGGGIVDAFVILHFVIYLV
jgi:hypothetical protein